MLLKQYQISFDAVGQVLCYLLISAVWNIQVAIAFWKLAIHYLKRNQLVLHKEVLDRQVCTKCCLWWLQALCMKIGIHESGLSPSAAGKS